MERLFRISTWDQLCWLRLLVEILNLQTNGVMLRPLDDDYVLQNASSFDAIWSPKLDTDSVVK